MEASNTVDEQRDIVIAGGGMVGISLALQLGRLLPASTGITLIEGFPLPQPLAEGRPDYHPSFDARSTALSYSTRLIYEEMGFWEELQRWLCPIETIHVSSRGRFGSTLMRATDCDWEALGYVVENAWLGTALVQALHRQGRVELISPTRVTAATASERGVRLALSGDEPRELEARLLVVADGAGSSLREQLGVAVAEKNYRHSAVIANITTAEPHAGCAFERFTDEGPLALLPLLPVAGGSSRSALVWTLPPDRAAAMHAASDEDFLAELQSRFGYRLGRLTQVGERHVYPLSLVTASEQVRRGVVVMGNAAHTLHPVAGQGYNLALRDVAQLAQTVAAAVAAQRSPGELTVLQGYQQRQAVDQQRTIGFSDYLPELFMRDNPLLAAARDLALAGLDVVAPAKQAFVRQAAGVAALEGTAHD